VADEGLDGRCRLLIHRVILRGAPSSVPPGPESVAFARPGAGTGRGVGVIGVTDLDARPESLPAQNGA
jgi:hypothetical protein